MSGEARKKRIAAKVSGELGQRLDLMGADARQRILALIEEALSLRRGARLFHLNRLSSRAMERLDAIDMILYENGFAVEHAS